MTLVAVILGLLPGFVWLVFYLREDKEHPEPKGLIALTFVNGAAFAFVALGMEFLAQGALSSLRVPLLGILAFTVFSLIEEAVKFIAAYVVVHNRPEFDEPIDAMIYTVVAALGFATVENIGVATAPVGESLFLANVFQLITFRFVGATLLHALASGIIGYHWALGIAQFGHPRTQIIKGLAIATVLHAVFNFIIFKSADMGFAMVFLLAIGLFVLGDFEKLKHKPV